MKHTKKEISLCRQVAKKHRKDIKYGDWYWSKSYNKPLLAMDYGFKINEQEWSQVFKIWTISDCLEFFKKKGYKTVRLNEHEYGVGVSVFPEKELELGEGEYGNTRLEACLKVVLAVLKKGGK